MMRRALPVSCVALVLAACTPSPSPVTPAPDSSQPGRHVAGPTARDSALEQRAARLELRLAERDAEVEDLQARLDEAREEIVRTLAKLQTVASKAEAASAIAETEIAVQGLRAASPGGGGTQTGAGTEVGQSGALLQQASAEFAKQNYGGAVYLANQAKRAVSLGRSRLGGTGSDRPSLRSGEVAFAVAVPLRAIARGKMREGPGSTYRVLFTVEPGATLTGYSYVDQWVRVEDESGHAGWMYVTLVGRRGD